MCFSLLPAPSILSHPHVPVSHHTFHLCCCSCAHFPLTPSVNMCHSNCQSKEQCRVVKQNSCTEWEHFTQNKKDYKASVGSISPLCDIACLAFVSQLAGC